MAKKFLDPATPHRDAKRVTSAVGDCDAFFAVIYIYMYIRLYTFQAALRVDFVWKTLELGHRTLVASAFILQYGSHSGLITSLLYTGARGNLEAMSNEGPVNRAILIQFMLSQLGLCQTRSLDAHPTICKTREDHVLMALPGCAFARINHSILVRC